MKPDFLWTHDDGAHARTACPWVLALGSFLDVLTEGDADAIARALAA